MGANKALDLALRRNRGKQIRSNWLHALQTACDMENAPISFLTLEETEKVKDAFFEKLKSPETAEFFHQYWPYHAFDEVITLLSKQGIKVGSTPVISFSNVDQYIGAALLPADKVLTHAAAVWRVVDEDLSITTPNLCDGLCLEYNFYTPTGEFVKEGIYELTTWGNFTLRVESHSWQV